MIIYIKVRNLSTISFWFVLASPEPVLMDSPVRAEERRNTGDRTPMQMTEAQLRFNCQKVDIYTGVMKQARVKTGKASSPNRQKIQDPKHQARFKTGRKQVSGEQNTEAEREGMMQMANFNSLAENNGSGPGEWTGGAIR